MDALNKICLTNIAANTHLKNKIGLKSLRTTKTQYRISMYVELHLIDCWNWK